MRFITIRAFFQLLLDLSKHTEQVCSITQHFIITSIGVCGLPVNRSTLFIDWSAKPTNKQTKKKEKKKGLSPLLHLTVKYLTSAILSAASRGLGVLDAEDERRCGRKLDYKTVRLTNWDSLQELMIPDSCERWMAQWTFVMRL